MSRRNNLLLGAIAGASFALGYWLNSDKGRTFRKDAEDTVNDAYQRGQKTAMDAVEKTSSVINDVIDSGAELMKKARETAMAAENHVKKNAKTSA